MFRIRWWLAFSTSGIRSWFLFKLATAYYLASKNSSSCVLKILARHDKQITMRLFSQRETLRSQQLSVLDHPQLVIIAARSGTSVLNRLNCCFNRLDGNRIGCLTLFPYSPQSPEANTTLGETPIRVSFSWTIFRMTSWFRPCHHCRQPKQDRPGALHNICVVRFWRNQII